MELQLFQFRPNRCSEGFADVRIVLHGILRKFEWERTVYFTQVGGAASKKDDYAVENEIVRALVCFLSWSLKDHEVPF